MGGYVYSQQSKMLILDSHNIHMEVYDANGEKIATRLFCANKGVFNGNFNLKEIKTSGMYYLRFFTNWMNNFAEDISSTYAVEIIKISDQDYSSAPKYYDLYMDIYPESGVFVAGVPNTLSIKVTNHKSEVLGQVSGTIVDEKNTVVATFKTSTSGFAKFDILDPLAGHKYQAVIEQNGHTYTQALPTAVSNATTFSVVNYALPGKTIFKVKSNSKSQDIRWILISHNDNTTLLPVADVNKEIIVNNTELFPGVNTARLLDYNLNMVAERVFYNSVTVAQQTIGSYRKNFFKEGEWHIVGKVPDKGFASASVLPYGAEVVRTQNVYNSLYINPYTQSASLLPAELFQNINRQKAFEIDLFMVSQSAKEKFKNIIGGILPENKFSFDRGISINARITESPSQKQTHWLTFFSMQAGILEKVILPKNNEIEFKNMVLADSSWVTFTLVDKTESVKPFMMYPTIKNTNRSFNKSIKIPKNKTGLYQIKEEPISKEQFPAFLNSILIDEVEVTITKTPRLKHTRDNASLRGYGQQDFQGMDHMRLGAFLELHGFKVERSNTGQTVIMPRAGNTTSINGTPPTSQIWVNSVHQAYPDIVGDLYMSEIEEIYLNPREIVPGMNNYAGVVKIYTKNKMGQLRDYNEKDVKKLQIVGGFARELKYYQPDYISYDDSFFKFGTVYWESNLEANDAGEFYLKFSNQNQSRIKIYTEGVTLQGEVFSQINEIDLEN